MKQVIKPSTAILMNKALAQVVERGSGRRAQLPMTQAAGKTGTSQAYRDAWFIGYTGNYTAGVWVGNDNFKPMNRVTGGRIPAMIWQHMMNVIHEKIDLMPIFGLEDIPFKPNISIDQKKSEETKLITINSLNDAMIPILNQLIIFVKNEPIKLTESKN
ncbi:penicillin-binding transpeptidase domain-containing protein [Bartonella sp. DGB1]|uniref:penicillin-binding transpeptidase domain-containing protein n=1 Tax=Bartonella sp. DGB1 TaxID=3239807 RepID=UPI003526ADEE